MSQILVVERPGAVQYDEREVGDRQGTARSRYALRLDRVVAVAQASRIHERDPKAQQVDRLGDQIARRPRNVRHDRARRPHERVEEARLAGIGTADDDDLQSLPHETAAPSVLEQGRKPAEDGKRLMHCQMELNGGTIMFCDGFPEYGHPAKTDGSFTMQLVVADGHVWWDRAIAAGCTVESPYKLEFWGDMYGVMRDPFGIAWSVVSPA